MNRKLLILVQISFLNMVFLSAVMAGEETKLSSGHGTNIQVSSEEVEPFSFETKKKEDRLTFYKDKDVAVDLNDDAEPNLNMQF